MRVVVVGAGAAGLAVAARLAATGHEVLVLEQAVEPGGKLGWQERDGFAWDTGPSLLTYPEVYRDLFRDTGSELSSVVDLQRLDVACHYRFPDGVELDLPGSASDVVPALDAALGSGSEWASLMERARAVWEASEDPFLRSPVSTATLARLTPHLRDLRTIAPWETLRGIGSRYLTDPHLVMLLDRYATYSGSDPRLAPAALLAVPHLEQEHGSWYVRGGLRRLVSALADRVTALGAEIRCGVEVVEVVVSDGRASGVRLADGSLVAAEAVVAAGDAARTLGPLLSGATLPVRSRLSLQRARAALAQATPSLSGFVLLLGLRGRTPGLAHHTVLFPDDYDAEFDAVFGTGPHQGHPRPVDDPTVYVSAPDDPATRPDDDSEAWFVLVNAPRHSPDDRRAGIDWRARGLTEAYAQHVLSVMARRGLDVRDRVVVREVLTPADLEERTLSVGGSIYGTSSNGARSAFLRPSNRSPVPGLHLVGGTSHPGGGLPLVAMSAQIVAEQIGPA